MALLSRIKSLGVRLAMLPFHADDSVNDDLEAQKDRAALILDERFNLDAVEKNGNEFNENGLKQDGEWLQSPAPDSNGFMRYRVLESKGNHYKVEYQENGGGTLTTASTIEFDIEKRNIQHDNKPVTIRVLRVSSYNQK
jgi:hypothetical protein